MESRIWFTVELLLGAAVLYVLMYLVLPLLKVEPAQAGWSLFLASVIWGLRLLQKSCTRT